MATVLSEPPVAASHSLQQFVLEPVSWNYYLTTLDEIGEGPVRVSYFQGRMELMSPLPKHEGHKKVIGRIIETLTEEFEMPIVSLGSTTFHAEEKLVGLEPDECYYLANAEAVLDMERFDPAIYPPPDLVVEVELTRKLVPRLPIYAALGTPEVWRWSAGKIEILLLSKDAYVPSPQSRSLPMLKLPQLQEWVDRLVVARNASTAFREFRGWCKTLRE